MGITLINKVKLKLNANDESLGNKKFEIPVNQEITQDSKIFLAYKVKDDKLTDLQSVSHNGKVIWTNPN